MELRCPRCEADYEPHHNYCRICGLYLKTSDIGDERGDKGHIRHIARGDLRGGMLGEGE